MLQVKKFFMSCYLNLKLNWTLNIFTKETKVKFLYRTGFIKTFERNLEIFVTLHQGLRNN